jgi:hypothetical protein
MFWTKDDTKGGRSYRFFSKPSLMNCIHPNGGRMTSHVLPEVQAGLG